MSRNVSDISTVNRIVTERTVKGQCVFVCLLHCINSDKFVLSNKCHEMYHISRYIMIVMKISNINVK